MNEIVNIQNINFEYGLNLEDKLFFFLNGKMAIIKIAKIRAITPPNFLGMDRKMAYANRKYHSGWIWTGVLKGLAGLKLSGSPKLYG